MIIFSWILSSVCAKHTFFKSLLCKNCKIWRDKCVTKVGELCKIIHVLNFYFGTRWHWRTIHFWSRVLFLSSLKPNKDFFGLIFLDISICEFSNSNTKFLLSSIFGYKMPEKCLCTLYPEQISNFFTKFTLRRAQIPRA